jgi:hypothetical protein
MIRGCSLDGKTVEIQTTVGRSSRSSTKKFFSKKFDSKQFNEKLDEMSSQEEQQIERKEFINLYF